VLVDDHPIVREGLVLMMSRHADLSVCGEASSAEEALAVIEEIKPDLAIVDIFLEGTNGIELTKILHGRYPEMPILILSMHDESLYAERAIRAGAMGYVMKQEASRTIVDAIHAVMGGSRYVSSRVGDMLGDTATGANGSDADDFGAIERLSSRELDIFKLIGAGESRSKIAEILKISIKTVETHRANMKYKLNAASAAELKQCAEAWVAAQR
jgi:DNA-binding NarL/FixJ family response regulator